MKKIWLLLNALALIVLSPSIGFSQSAGIWQAGIYQEMPYRILMPENYDTHKKYPLVLFLHGVGERGTDNNAQLINGVERFNLPEYRKRYPAIVVVPQYSKSTYFWTHFPYRANKLPRPGFLAISIVKSLIHDLAVDTHRVYVTGISTGGFAAWDFIVRYNDIFAAALPVSAQGDIAQAENLAQTPIWAFHNRGDFLFSTMFDRLIYEKMQTLGTKMKYTEYLVYGHDAWTRTFENTEVLDWLFAQRHP